MKHSFYDCKKKEKVEAEVLKRFCYDGKRYAFEGKSETGGKLFSFVGKVKFDEANELPILKKGE